MAFLFTDEQKAASIPENTWPSYGVRDVSALRAYKHCTPTGCASAVKPQLHRRSLFLV